MIQNTFQRLIVKFLKNVGVFNSGNGASRRDDRGTFGCTGGAVGDGGEWKVSMSGKASPLLQLLHYVPDGAFRIRSLEASPCGPFNYLRKARQSSQAGMNSCHLTGLLLQNSVFQRSGLLLPRNASLFHLLFFPPSCVQGCLQG